MNNRQLASKEYIENIEKPSLLNLQPRRAWLAIIGLFATIALLLVIGAAKLLIVLFPLGSLAVGIFLYRQYPLLYVGFTLWMWFVAPFIRRLIDYQCGYNVVGPFELSSLLVSSISIATTARYLPKIYKREGIPFVLCFGSVLYALIVGLLRQPTVDYDHEIIIALGWFSPMLFGFHLFVHWQHYPFYRENLKRVFFWGVIVMGLYGIIQFLTAPAWDKFFLLSSVGRYHSWMGVPEPLGIRVWSTVTSPFTFGAIIMPGLVLLLISKEKLRYVAAGLGYLAFLLAQARTAWGSLIVALAIFVFSMRSSHQIRVIISIAIVVAIALPLLSLDPFSEVITSRLETFQDISSDGSFQSRIGQFDRIVDYAMTEFIGWGLIGYEGIPIQSLNIGVDQEAGISATDNGYLSILISLGWLGTLPYVLGIVLIFSRLFMGHISRLDSFAVASRAIALGSLARMFTNNVTLGAFAITIWTFVGIAMAAEKYHLYLHKNKPLQGQLD